MSSNNASSPPKPHVLIIGAGIGGLFLAQFLRKQGVPFSLFERDASFDARPPGYAIGLNLLEDYAAALPADVPPLRSASHLRPLALPSEFIVYLPNSDLRVGVQDSPATPCVRAHRGRLRQLLLTGVDVQWGKKAVRVEEGADAVMVHFADGTAATGDLLVGVDGVWSKIREHVLGRPNADVVDPVLMAIIHGRATLRGAALEEQLRLAHSAYVTVPQPGHIFFSGLDHITDGPDGLSGTFYWFLYERDDTAAASDHWLRTASREAKYAHVLARVEAAGLDPKFRGAVVAGGPAGVDDAFMLYYDAILPPLPPPGRVLLIGDAAHPMTPFRGEGGIAAIKDALAITQLLATTDTHDIAALQPALAALQTRVLEQGAAMVQLSRDVINVYGAPLKSGAKPRGWGYEVQPIPVETGPLLHSIE